MSLSYTLYGGWSSTVWSPYNHYNEAERLLGFSISRGREEVFSDGFVRYPIGEAVLSLDNYDGRYDPWDVDSALGSLLKPGVEMRLAADHDDLVGETVLFLGTIKDVKVYGYRDNVKIILEDGWALLRDNYIEVGSGNSGAATTDCLSPTTGGFFDLFYDVLASTDYYYYPDGHATVIGYTTDMPLYFWYDEGSVKGFIEEIAFGTFGRAGITADNYVFFYPPSYPTTSIVTIYESEALKSITINSPWDALRSEVIGSWDYGFDGYSGVSSTNVKTQFPIVLGYDETFLHGSTAAAYNVSGTLTPYVTGVDYFTFINNINYYDITLTSTGLGTTVTYQNFVLSASTDDGYVDFTGQAVGLLGTTHTYRLTLDYYGEGLDPTADLVYATTDSSIKESEFHLYNNWLNLNYASTDVIADNVYRVARTVNSIHRYLETYHPFPKIQLIDHYGKQFIVDVEDKVTLDYDHLNISGDYYVSKIRHETIGSPQEVMTTLWLYPVPEIVTT